MSDVTLWKAPSSKSLVHGTGHTEIIGYARQLSKRDIEQVRKAYDAGSYEMVSTFVWSRTVSALKDQLSELGAALIGEMLGRSDIGDGAVVAQVITDSEALTLAEELGMVTSTHAMRLRHALEMTIHFASSRPQEEDDDAAMTAVDALSCLQACVEGVLSQPKHGPPEAFTNFRHALETKDFSPHDDEIVTLLQSPYFYLKTTLSVLLALIRTASGAALEHALANLDTILPLLWNNFRKPEKWQTGNTYAQVSNDGRKTAVLGMRKVLLKVKGFDFVPESLRSNTFTAMAGKVLEAHEGMNNFYNEAAPLRSLANLGTTIPMPAFPYCMRAIMACRLGNGYGVSFSSQPVADELLKDLAKDKWEYFVRECLPQDEVLLRKIALPWSQKARSQWVDVFFANGLDKLEIEKGTAVFGLWEATKGKNLGAIQAHAARTLKALGYEA